MSSRLPEVLHHEHDERRKSAIYFAVIMIAAVFAAFAFLYVVR